MDKEIFNSIMRGMEEADLYSKGKKIPVIVHHFHEQKNAEVKPIRKKLGMTQREFADTFGFSLYSLKNWEPTGHANRF